MDGFGAGLRNCGGLDASAGLVDYIDIRRTGPWVERAALAWAIMAKYLR